MAWGSKLQSVTALSTTEAEIHASRKTARPAIFLTRFLDELQRLYGPPPQNSLTVLILGYNKDALTLLK